MNITRHISLDEDHALKLKPYLEKNHGNFGAALREMINLSEKYGPYLNTSAIDTSAFSWVLSEIEGTLLPDNVLDETIDPMLVHSMERLEKYLKQRFTELEWGIDLSLRYDSESLPSNVLLEIKGASAKIRFVACLVSQYLVKNSLDHNPLEIKDVIKLDECIKVELSRSNKKESENSIRIFWGEWDEIMKIIKNRPAFWKAVIGRHLLSNYNMVTVHRNYFEDLLAGKIPLGEITIENLSKKPLCEIPLHEMLYLIKDVYEISRIADRVDIDRDSIAVFHSFRNEEAIKRLKKSLVALLEANGHLYDATPAANMIVLTHRPDIGIKINEIVGNMKNSHSTLDHELVIFMAFLKGIRDIPDIPSSLCALGRRIGVSLMQEYENENSIKVWNLETFRKALEVIDSRLHRKSEWKLDGKSLLYTIKRCALATEGNTFDKYICQTARETFKGALDYAFGNKAELNINKLVTHGDNFCEVMIRIP